MHDYISVAVPTYVYSFSYVRIHIHMLYFLRDRVGWIGSLQMHGGIQAYFREVFCLGNFIKNEIHKIPKIIRNTKILVVVIIYLVFYVLR